jgi:hypothetical protein
MRSCDRMIVWINYRYLPRTFFPKQWNRQPGNGHAGRSGFKVRPIGLSRSQTRTNISVNSSRTVFLLKLLNSSSVSSLTSACTFSVTHRSCPPFYAGTKCSLFSILDPWFWADYQAPRTISFDQVPQPLTSAITPLWNYPRCTIDWKKYIMVSGVHSQFSCIF